MPPLDQLFAEAQPSTPNCQYLPLTDLVPCTGIHGRFVKLVCLDDADLPIEATADEKYFHLVEPYLEDLRLHRQGDADPPVVPVFKGNDGRWRFSWHAAARDNPDLEPPTPESDDRAFRMQVSVPGSLASRFKRAANQRGLTHTDFLLHLIRNAST